MMSHVLTIWSFIIVSCCIECIAQRGISLGCFSTNADVLNTHTGGSVETCLSACEQIYYRYSLLSDGSNCYCGNVPGNKTVSDELCNMSCPKDATQKCGGDEVASVYDTGVDVPGPPTNLEVRNVTETSIRLKWKAPDAHGFISSFDVKVSPLKSYSDNAQVYQSTYSNITRHANIIGLQPGTLYNVSVAALGESGAGPSADVKAETIIGIPDPVPPPIDVLERRGDKLLIHIPQVVNVNGPITRYRIVVNLNDHKILPEYLTDYYEATKVDLPYYITAEIDQYDIRHDFIVGDGKTYNGYLNAPLTSLVAHVSLGIVSQRNGVTKVRYAHTNTETVAPNVAEEPKVSSIVMVLGVAVAIGVVLLIIGIGLLIILRRKYQQMRNHRSSQSLPLSMSEPCIDIENTGFLPEEEERVDHYGNLKRQLWNIPRNFLEVDNSVVVGEGTFGKFVKGTVQQHGQQTKSLVQVIGDQNLDAPKRKEMLKELDLLIKSSGHESVIALVGICERPDTLYVVLEDSKQNLKDLLLTARYRDIQKNKFAPVSEASLIQMCLNIAKGMLHLSNKKIIHQRLCCRNIILGEGNVAKVTGFGLSHIQPLSIKPDYRRWTAQEIFRHSRYTTKSDVWSYGCLLWEVFALGGTLYPQVASRDLESRVSKGMRPLQLPYIGDELYQVCLQCWQIDLDERPSFSNLVTMMERLLVNIDTGILSFTYYNDFSYEPYSPDLEML